MDWATTMSSFSDELEKMASERKKPLSEKVIDVGAPVLVGSGVGKTLTDTAFGAFGKDPGPRRKTIGTLLGALSGLAYHRAEQKKKERRRAHRAVSTLSKTGSSPFKFTGTATPRFLSKPGKTISNQAPKIGRLGTLPKMP